MGVATEYRTGYIWKLLPPAHTGPITLDVFLVGVAIGAESVATRERGAPTTMGNGCPDVAGPVGAGLTRGDSWRALILCEAITDDCVGVDVACAPYDAAC